jgi:aryl-alcohol dehydrogenase-like predicted oxidoreductase
MTLGHADDLGHRYEPAAMERHAHEVLDAAFAAGVRYFDVARSYGQGERFLSTWLVSRDLAPGMVTVGSKWGYTYTADWQVNAAVHEVKEHSLAVLKRQIAETRALLGSHLSLYNVHSATLESGVLENAEVLCELARLRGEGLRIGLSVTGVRQAETIRRAMDVRLDGQRLFDCVQATWNVLETSASAALAEAHAAGLGVIVKEALANGRLTERNADPAFASAMRVLRSTATRLGTSVDSLCLSAVLAQLWADVVLSGAAAAQQVRSNARALDVKLDAEARDALAGLVRDPREYWAARSELRWN